MMTELACFHSEPRGALLKSHPPRSPRAWVKDAGPFFAHGHRLSSLYREDRKPPIPFFALKILRNLRARHGGAVEYLRSKEAGGVLA
jgi:hypothetical protein